MKSKKRKGLLAGCLRSLKVVWKAAPGILLLHCCFTILHGLSWTLQVVFAQRFFDSAEQMVTQGTGYSGCMLALVAMILAYALSQVMNGVDNCHSRILNLHVTKYVNLQIFRKIDTLSCAAFEDTQKLDQLNKAMNGGENLMWIAVVLTDSIFFYTTYFLSMGAYLFTLKPILCVSILLVFLPSLCSNFIQLRTFRHLEDLSAPIRRECDYYEQCAADLKDTRILGITGYFRNLFSGALRQLNRLVFRAQLKKSMVDLSMKVITTIGYGGILLMIVVLVMRQEISVGAFVAVLASIISLFDFMEEVISQRIGWASENAAALENYLDFMDEPSQPRPTGPMPQNADIQLKDLSYRYPFANRNALNNIHLTIRHGETVAIVGENGSGKSTLCRILLGLYPPTRGELTIGGKPAETIDRQRDSAIFQNYNRYHMTLRENLHMSCTQRQATEEALLPICAEAGVDLQNGSFDQGLDTMLGREFDGAELSGGQWQRVAIGRGLFRPSDFIVLDEPTSAIDPLQETRLYQEFMGICRDKTAVIVTHRLGSVKIADRIVVLKDGCLAEEGTHEELMALGGEYKRMFDAQSQWYV